MTRAVDTGSEGSTQKKNVTTRKRKRVTYDEPKDVVAASTFVSIYCPNHLQHSKDDSTVDVPCGWIQLTLTTNINSLRGIGRCKKEDPRAVCATQSYFEAVKECGELVPEGYFMIKLPDDELEEYFIAPKQLLADSGDYFKGLFAFSGIETTTRTVTFTGEFDKPLVIERFIEFLYHGKYDGVYRGSYHDTAEVEEGSNQQEEVGDLLCSLEEHVEMYIFANRLQLKDNKLAIAAFCAVRDKLVAQTWPSNFSKKKDEATTKFNPELRDGIFKITEMIYSNTADSRKATDPMRALIASLHSFLVKEMAMGVVDLRVLGKLIVRFPELAASIAEFYVSSPKKFSYYVRDLIKEIA